MADIVLSPLVGTVVKRLETLSSVRKGEARMIWQAGYDLGTLLEMLQRFQCVLADAEEMLADREQMQMRMKTLEEDWLRELKDIAYDADDVLDDLQYDVLEESDQTNKGKGKLVRNFFPYCFCFRPNQILSRLDVAEKIKSINERIATVSSERERFCFERHGVRREIKTETERPPSSSVPTENKSKFLGRDQVKKEIVKLLLSDDDEAGHGQNAYSVISIVGMEGLATTTLAQHVYSDERVEKHFEVRAWVRVSEIFDVVKITKDIIESAEGKCDSSAFCDVRFVDDFIYVQSKLIEILEAKTFLIVLDDVWNEEHCRWDSLRAAFKVGAKGSKIVVTTRTEAVSRAMCTDHPYCMKPLANDDCVLLFLQCAFAGEGHSAHPELMQIGENLVKRHCQGLPLAAKVLGGLLYRRKELHFWSSILNSQIWISGDNKNEVMKALRVSYHHLPPHIKQCFAFCSIFPKDYVFDKDELVRLWMAQGFILPAKSSTEGMTLEESGSHYFDLLLQRSFFQTYGEDGDGFSVAYKMHDCIHDLAVSVSSEECLRMEHETVTPPNDRLHNSSLLEAHINKAGENLEAFNHKTERPPTSSVPIENEFEFLGRDKDRKEIIELLLSDDTCGGLQAFSCSVISIVGRGGLGKTTLAQQVYNDESVKKHFEVTAWACVSENFTVAEITKDIIESAGKNCNSSSIDRLLSKLVGILSAKRFLIVLDDVWNRDFCPWDRLWGAFNAGAKGSKVVVTMRSEAVSRAEYTNHPYFLKPLANNDCVSLLLQHAFAGEEYGAYPEFKRIGEELVEKRCKGLPLAAKVLGSLLRGRKELDFWESILNNEIWINDGNENEVNEVMKALRVSYHHLPRHMKQCFTFCSVFSKDYIFRKDELVRLWIAQGFILPAESMTLEEIGSQYFDHLLQMSLFQRCDEYGSEFSVAYKMHDCIHDLAVSISYATNPTRNDGLHHLSLLEAHVNKEGENLEAFNQCKRLRTLLIKENSKSTQEWMCQQAINDRIMNFKCLRVLVLTGSLIEELPDSIANLKYLRYLDLSGAILIKELPKSVSSLYNLQTLKLCYCRSLHSLPGEIGKLKHLRYLDLSYVDNITQLPESFSSVYNLQTLKLYKCFNLCSLPRETRNLINLRHLDFEGCGKLTTIPSEMGRLSYLQTLPRFIVGKESGNKIGELKGLTQLRGRISIEELENVLNAEEAKEACLKDIACIQNLMLCWDDEEEEGSKINSLEEAPLEMKLGEILEALQPCKNVESLSISGYKGNIYPMWLQGKELPNLKHFALKNCKNCKSLPPLGQFGVLERVSIGNMEGVKRIGHEFYGDGEIKASFPQLKDLDIMFMPNLEEWCEFEEGANGFSLLEKLFVVYCPKLSKMPSHFSSVKYMSLHSCYQLTYLPVWLSLAKLTLSNCNESLLQSWVPHLTSLSYLEIGSFDDLTSLPKGMLHPLFNLKHLRICSCQKLEYLVDNEDKGLPSNLVSLEIHECRNLKSLGEKRLPTTLQCLVIHDCPQLKKVKEDNKNWVNISHIPDINIDNEIIS